MIRTNELTQQIFREHMRKYFATLGADAIIHIHKIVEYLLKNPEVNRLEQKYSKEKIEEMLKTIRKLRELYSWSEEFRTVYDKLDETDKDYLKKKKRIMNDLLQISTRMPMCEVTLIQLFVDLTEGTDLIHIRPSSASDQMERKRRGRY